MGKVYQSTNDIKIKPTKSGRFWVNYQNKCYIAVIEDEISMKLLSNKTLTEDDKDWEEVEEREGWHTKLVLVSEVKIFNSI